MRVCSRAIIIVILVLIFAAEENPWAAPRQSESDSRASSKNNKSGQSKPDPISPYEIGQFVSEHHASTLAQLWQRLGIGPEFAGEAVLDHFDGFMNRCRNCESELFEVDLDDEPDKEILVRISDIPQESCRYLVFKQLGNAAGDRWKLLGHIDHDFGRYQMPQHAAFQSGGQNWLIVEEQTDSGNSYVAYSRRLFAVRDGRLRELLKFPAEGHQQETGSVPRREFSSRLIGCETKGGVTTVEVEFSVSYHLENLEWQKKQKAVFRGGNGKLSLDQRESQMSKQEFKAVYENPLSNEDLLKYNFDELKRIAQQPASEDRELLSDFLTQCDDTKEKKRLVELLRK